MKQQYHWAQRRSGTTQDRDLAPHAASLTSLAQNTTHLTSLLPLHAATTIPLQQQLYQGLRQAIVSFQLPGGSRLPSSRALAKDLNLSRMPVAQAYQQLLLEGYVDGRRGSGTYVSHTLPDTLLSPAETFPTGGGLRTTRLSTVERLADVALSSPAHSLASSAFRLGQPALDAFPHRIWQRLLAHCYRHCWQALFGYQNPAGYWPLREAIASYLAVARGVRCTPEQVIVTSGSQHGLDLIARTLPHVGNTILMEDPGYFGAKWAFRRAGVRLLPVTVDSAGMDTAFAEEHYPDARLAFVTPSHQFPLGATMSLERRLALLEWAKRRQGRIVEDDYDSEYRYNGCPLPALQGLDTTGRVLYLGTFSKSLFPSLRLGYLVVPLELMDTFVASLPVLDLHASALEQAVVARFMAQGHFVRHLRRMRQLYAKRQGWLREAISQHLSGLLEVHPDPAGMHLVAWLPPKVDGTRIAQVAEGHDLQVLALSQLSLRPLQRDALVLGYAALDEDQIAEGVRELARVLESVQTPRIWSGWTRPATEVRRK